MYIYHNKIDAVGDKANTEKQVFEACTDSVEEMKKSSCANGRKLHERFKYHHYRRPRILVFQ